MSTSAERESKSRARDIRGVSDTSRRDRSSRAANDNPAPTRGPACRPAASRFPFGAPPCRNYRPSRTVMQSTPATARPWVLGFEPAGRKWIEPLEGCTATDDPFAPVRLTFPCREAANQIAEHQGLEYWVADASWRRFVPKRDANNPELSDTAATGTTRPRGEPK